MGLALCLLPFVHSASGFFLFSVSLLLWFSGLSFSAGMSAEMKAMALG